MYVTTSGSLLFVLNFSTVVQLCALRRLMSVDNFTFRKGTSVLCVRGVRGTFHRREVVYGQFQTLAPPEHTYRVPFIIIQILTRKNGLGTFACGTVQTIVNTHTRTRHRQHSRQPGGGGQK